MVYILLYNIWYYLGSMRLSHCRSIYIHLWQFHRALCYFWWYFWWQTISSRFSRYCLTMWILRVQLPKFGKIINQIQTFDLKVSTEVSNTSFIFTTKTLFSISPCNVAKTSYKWFYSRLLNHRYLLISRLAIATISADPDWI